MIEDWRYWASRGYITVSALKGKSQINISHNGWPHVIHNRVESIWGEVNRDRRVEEAIGSVFWDYMQDTMDRYDTDSLDIKFPVGRVFFAENCLTYNREGELFQLEPVQVIDLIDPFDTVNKRGRRMGKTTDDKIIGFHTVICYPNNLIGVIERNWPKSKNWLRVKGFRQWLNHSPYLLSWAGGFQVEHAINWLFGNGSGIFVCPAGVIEKYLVGEGLMLLIEDEQAKHPFKLDESGKPEPSGLEIILQGQKISADAPPISHRISSTPEGKGTPFYVSEQDESYFRSFAPVGCPKGYERWLCGQRLNGKLCPYYSVNRHKAGKSEDTTMCCTARIKYKHDKRGGIKVPNFDGWFWRLPHDRTREGNAAVAMTNLFRRYGEEYWLQEFMGENLDYTGNAFNRMLVDKWMDGTVEEAHAKQTDNYGTIFSSDRFCVAALDIGLTQHHQSCLVVLEQQDNGQWHQIRVEYIQAWAKEHLGKDIAFDHYKGEEGDPGIFDIVLDMLKGPYGNYEIQYIAGDASGPGGKSEIGYTFRKMVEEHFGSDMVIEFKILSKSEEFGGKIENVRVMKHLMGTGRYKTVVHDKLRMETLGWKLDVTAGGALKGGPPKKGGKVKSDDGVMASMMVTWLAFKYLGGADYVPDISTGPTIQTRSDTVSGSYDNDDLESHIGEVQDRWYDDPGY